MATDKAWEDKSGGVLLVMGLEPEKPDRLYLVILLVINVGNWLGLCVPLVRHWHAMPSHMRSSVICLAVIFPLLWSQMLREKCSLLLLVGMTLVFFWVSFGLLPPL